MPKTTKIIIWLIVVIVIIAGIWWGVSKESTQLPSAKKEVIKIGVVLPLTGDISSHGVDSKNAIELALAEVNKSEKRIEIIYEDDQCEPSKTVTAVNKLINVDKVKIILGPFCSGSALAAAPIIQKNKVFMLSGSATNPKLAGYDLFFRTIPSDSYQGKFAAEYAYNVLKKRKVAISYAQNDYCVGLKEAFKKRFTELGGKVVLEVEHQEGATDLRTQLTKIKNSDADFIYLVPYPIDGGNFLKQAKELGIDLLILAPESVEDSQIIKIAGEAAEGLLFTRAKEEKNEEFISKYNQVYGKNPGAYAPFYYDAVKILASALSECDENVNCIRNYFIGIHNYKGVSGVINFNERGDLVGRKFMVKTIKNGKFVPYKD